MSIRSFFSTHILNKSVNDYRFSFRDKKQEKKKQDGHTKLVTNYFTTPNNAPRLHIGCGPNILPNWLNTDLLYNEQVAYLDASKTFPFKENQFNFIYSEHLFEHLTFEQEVTMLNECKRTLKNGGVIRIATPSADFLASLLTNPSSENMEYIEWSFHNIPGLKNVAAVITNKEDYKVYVVNNFYRDWGHKTIHNLTTIRNLLQLCGFENIEEKKVGESSFSELTGIENHMNIIPSKFNLLETMVIEATVKK